MRKSGFVALSALAALAFSTQASAQDLSVQNWQPVSPGDSQMIGVHSTRHAPSLKPVFGLSLSLIDDPLVLVNDSNDRVSTLVDHRLEAQLSVAMGIGDRIEIGAAIPFIVSQKSRTAFNTASDTEYSDLGDIALIGRYRFKDAYRGFNFGLRLELRLPTATNNPYTGDSGPSVAPAFVADYKRGDLLVAANVGFRIRDTSDIGDLRVGNALTAGVGASHRLGGLPLPLSIVGEIATEWAGSDSAEIPIELRAALRLPIFDSKLSVLAGYGHGLVPGYGAPDHRLFAMLSYPNPKPAQAPQTLVAPTDADPDGDGLTDTDLCPAEPEDFDGHKDDDGCPDPDNDFDGILDINDACPLEAEIINGVDDDDGCPDEGKRLVVVGALRIQIRERVFFANNMDTILPRSEAVLSQLAKTIQRMPWLQVIRIEGHTDDRGEDAFNKDLSQRRADSVRRALTRLGVKAERLSAKGYGEEQPIDNNATLEGRANNRRVEFVIEKQASPPDGWKPPNDTVREMQWDSAKETE